MLTVPVEEIEQRARESHPGRAILTAITLIPYLLGWLARKTWMGAVFLIWAAVAGWRVAGGDDSPERDSQPQGWS